MASHSRIRVKEEELLSRRWGRLERVSFEYQRQNGEWQLQEREIYHHGHGAAVLLYDLQRRTVILIRQFRYAVYREDGGDGFLLEVPGGFIDEGDAEATVRAETAQETGYNIGEVQKLFSAFTSPGSLTEQVHYFVAPYAANARCGDGGGLAEEGEEIEVLEVAFDEALAWTSTGRIQDAKTILLLQHAALHLFNY